VMRYALLVMLAACSLGGKAPNYHYYVLDSHHGRATPVEGGRTLAIAQVNLPGYLDREQIATRTVENRLVYSSTDRWAEPLDQAFERTLREDLAARLAPSGIEVQSRAGSPTYELVVDVQRFERVGQDRVELWARWRVRSHDQPVARGETRVELP